MKLIINTIMSFIDYVYVFFDLYETHQNQLEKRFY